MARAHFVKKAQKDNPAAKKGESYYWWKFRYGGKRYSKERPHRSQLTQSAFLGQVYDLEDDISDLSADGTTVEDLKSKLEDWASQARELGEEAQESLNSMPEHLQDSSSSGELLQNRVEECDAWADRLESIDLDDEPGDGETAEEHLERLVEEVQAEGSYEGE